MRRELEPYLGGMVGQPPVSLWTARALILLGVLVIGWLIAGVLGYFLRHSALSVLVDRILGLVFGTVRGAVVIAVFVMLGEFVELNRVEWWKRSHLLPYASELAELDPELRGNGHENCRRRAIDAAGSLRECAESSASSAHSPVNQQIYDALTVLQHRGQDAAGIMTCDEGELFMRKQNGLVRDVFQQRHMLRLKGNIGIGHVRYPTAGCDSSSEAQPFFVNSPYGICLGHNGNLTNAAELAEVLIREDLRHLNTSSDSEVLLNVLASELSRAGTPRASAPDIFAAVTAVYRRCPRRFRRRVDDRRPRPARLPRSARHPPAGDRPPRDAAGQRVHAGFGERRARPARLRADARRRRRARRCSSTSTAASIRSSACRWRATRRASSSTSISRGPIRSSTTSRCTRRACAWATCWRRRSAASGPTTTSTS